MNKYWAIAMLVSFVVWSGFMYYEGASKERALCKQADEKHDLAQASVTIAAEKGVIATIGQQQTITQEVDNAYQIKKSSIDSQYIAGVFGLQQRSPTAVSNNMPVSTAASIRPNATAARPLLSKIFKLNAQECDENTEQLYGLQAWVKGQLAIKQPSAK